MLCFSRKLPFSFNLLSNKTRSVMPMSGYVISVHCTTLIRVMYIRNDIAASIDEINLHNCKNDEINLEKLNHEEIKFDQSYAW